jgi:hypothetical protein
MITTDITKKIIPMAISMGMEVAITTRRAGWLRFSIRIYPQP